MRKPSKILDKIEAKLQEIEKEIKEQEKVVRKEKIKLDRLLLTKDKTNSKRRISEMKDKDEQTVSKLSPGLDDGYTEIRYMGF